MVLATIGSVIPCLSDIAFEARPNLCDIELLISTICVGFSISRAFALPALSLSFSGDGDFKTVVGATATFRPWPSGQGRFFMPSASVSILL